MTNTNTPEGVLPPEEPDENLGETFLDRDSRVENRRIKILGISGALGRNGERRYIATTLTNDSTPSTVGTSTTISETTLRTHWRKVSH